MQKSETIPHVTPGDFRRGILYMTGPCFQGLTGGRRTGGEENGRGGQAMALWIYRGACKGEER